MIPGRAGSACISGCTGLPVLPGRGAEAISTGQECLVHCLSGDVDKDVSRFLWMKAIRWWNTNVGGQRADLVY